MRPVSVIRERTVSSVSSLQCTIVTISRISATLLAMVRSEVPCLGIEGFKFLVQRLELFLEALVAHGFANSYTHVAAGVQRPALRFDFLERRSTAQAGNICEFWLLTGKTSFSFASASAPPKEEINFLAAIEANEIGHKAYLGRCPFAVSPVHLPVDVAGVDEEYCVGTKRLSFALI